MATDGQVQLFQALKAHTFELKTRQNAASGRDRADLDHRIEATRLLLEWLLPILAMRPLVCQATRASPSLTAQVAQAQDAPTAPSGCQDPL